jgi:hypothetical protein
MDKTLIDNQASLNLIMRKTFIEIGLNLSDLTPDHNTFHSVIPGQSSTPIGCINVEVSCRSGNNKCREMLTFEVTSFNIGYNCILGRSFLLKFMAVIHTAYVTMKMPRPKGVITIKDDQRDALACENASLSHMLAALKPNRIIHKCTNVNCSSFHLRVFLRLSNPQGQRQTSTLSIPRDNFGERKAKFNLETSRTTQM